MSRFPIGPRRVVASADTTGKNTGKYTAIFDPSIMITKWPFYEVYKMVVTNAAASNVVHWDVFIGINQYEGFQSSGTATWSDPIPMTVDAGENVYFFFDLATSGVAPVVTLWSQVDPDIKKGV